jgi:single-stranded-DNA-specific exonuclease
MNLAAHSSAIVARTVPDAARGLAAAGMHPVLARVYAARGIASSSDLEEALARLPSPSALKGIGDAVRRLSRAIRDSEPVLIVGDYDADGATAAALGVLGLSMLGARVDFLVPNRFEFGYGLTPEIVDLAQQRRPRVIVTVDNGMASADGVAAASAAGIDVVVTDHHLPGPSLPAAAAIVNPNQPGCGFPSRNLAGVGVMFYVLAALRAHLREQGSFAASQEPRLADLLDLVALGTVADVVRLDHVNRILVRQGLDRIRSQHCRPGIRALLRAAGRDPARASAYDLGFVVGPRLNAAGRLDDMSRGIACLLADDESQALALAADLDALNQERRAIEANMQEEALLALAREPPGEAFSLTVFRPEWHQGVIGLLASRLKDRFHLPVVALAPGGDEVLKGSGRSIRGLHLRDALDRVDKRCPGLITRFGGHAAAAGLSLPKPHLERFAREFEAVARELLTPDQLQRRIETDGSLHAREATYELAAALGAQVWGQGFPAPLFDDEFRVVEQRIVGGLHRRVRLEREGTVVDGMIFRCEDILPERIRAVYRLDLNEFQGRSGLQLTIEFWVPA